MADFLWFVDRLYGRTDPKGLRSYGLRYGARIEAAETRTGSLELLLQQAVGLADPSHLLMLWVLLRGLPGAGRVISEIVGNYARAYHDFESGRLARAQTRALQEGRVDDQRLRRRLATAVRNLLEEDTRLRSLPPERRAEIARFAASVYSSDEDAVRRMASFAIEHLAEVDLEPDE
jgi:hypothetical protein